MNATIQVNDIVRFLNDVGGGRVTRVEGRVAYVEDSDGFERPAPVSDLIVVDSRHRGSDAYERPLDIKTRQVEPDKPSMPRQTPSPAVPPETIFETPEGNLLNVVLAYEPKNIKHLNTTTFYVTLVNDSNYFLYFTYMTRGDDTSEWQLRYHGMVEPNFQVQLEEFGHDDLNDMTHVAVQYVAFKQAKGFALKNPVLVEQRLDVTKFFKLHCFHDNDYFDVPVIALDIVRNDRPARQLVIDSSEIEQAMKQKRQADRPRRQPVQRGRNHGDIVVQDLHIGELLDNLNGLTNSDMLNVQLDKFNEVMKAHIKHPSQRIVFIHGKGEGVLRKAILDELRRHYPHCSAQDASFKEYGFGATQVTIHQ